VGNATPRCDIVSSVSLGEPIEGAGYFRRRSNSPDRAVQPVAPAGVDTSPPTPAPAGAPIHRT
jgi:hypothetical protein